jgi:two-component system, NarL family, sensor histidine kinase UhpB
MSLFWRIFLLNAAVLCAATLLLVVGPVTVSTPAAFAEVVVLLAGLVIVLVANAALLRVGLGPLQRLTRAMTTTDVLRPANRLEAAGAGEVASLITTYNTMLDRLERERASSAGQALSAQEAERSRIARELHDEIGQSLTAVLLDLKRVADGVPPELRAQVQQAQETTRDSLEEIRRIARRLRPGVLEELGLRSALKVLTDEVSAASGLTVQRDLASELPAMSAARELVVYRVAQESLTNVVRHAAATRVAVRLVAVGDHVELLVRDDGCGRRGTPEGAGLRGIRERALLIGADAQIEDHARGTTVRLVVPVRDRVTA